MEGTSNTSTAIAIRNAINALTTELVRADINPTCVTTFAHGDGSLSFMLHVDTTREFHSARGLFTATQPEARVSPSGPYQSCDGSVGFQGPKVTLFGPLDELPADCDSTDHEAVPA
jgi:hypothetical protein